MGAIGGLRRAYAWGRARRYMGPKVTATRYSRAVPAATLGLGAMAGMLIMVSNDVLAVNFTTSDHQFKVYSNYVQGISMGAFMSANPGYSATSRVGVAEIGIKQAKLNGFCAIVTESLPIIGDTSLIITAGTSVAGSFNSRQLPTADGAGGAITYDANGAMTGTSLAGAVTVTDMFIATTALTGYGNRISGLNVGQNAADTASVAQLTDSTGTWPAGQTAPVNGNLGLTASSLNIGGLNGSSYGVNLHGAVTLPHIRIMPKIGAVDQTECPAQAQ